MQTSSPTFSDDIEDEGDTRKKARRERGDDENGNEENEEEELELYSNDKVGTDAASFLLFKSKAH